MTTEAPRILHTRRAEYTSGTPVAGDTSYLTTDHLGSTRLVTDSGGNVKARYDYLPFGEEIASSVGSRSSVAGYGATDSTKQKFTQKERDSESGLDYFLARYYSSAQGRFKSSDPLLSSGTINDPQSWNRYSYGLNNPVKNIDPLGLYVFSSALGGSQSDEDLRKGAKNKKDSKTVENIISQRMRFRDALSQATAAANNPKLSESARQESQRAVNSYGAFNDGKKDNVVVGFVANKEKASTTGIGEKDGNIHIDLNLDVEQRSPVITVAHEGSHVADYQAYLAGTGSDVPLFFTENRAYFVSSYMAESLGLKSYYPGADEKTQVWNKGWEKSDSVTINRVNGVFATNPWSFTNQGPRLSDPLNNNKRY